MNTDSPLFILCFDSQEKAALADLAKVVGYENAEIALGSVQEMVLQLEARKSTPAYIIIDIGMHGKEILASIDEFAMHCEPHVSVVVIGGVNDITFYRELKQRGILEYFSRPASANDIRAIFAQAAQQNKQQGVSGSANGVVITCMSAASGDGASTLAVNLSYCFAEEQKLPTVLVDMDYQFGLIAKGLDLTAPFGIRELFDNPDRGLDDTIVEKMLVKYGERLRIISSPNELQILPPVKPEVIRDLIKVLRSKFKVVIIDVPHVWTPWTAAVLKNSDHNILVGQLWLRSLTHATRILNAWQSVGIAYDSISLIINRSGAKFKEGISAEEFERICRHKIDAHINNDIKALVNAENQGKPVYEAALEGSVLPKQFKQIVSTLVTKFSLPAVQSNVQELPLKKGILGLFDKKSGT
jgi:pilus assembly protein CpaE